MPTPRGYTTYTASDVNQPYTHISQLANEVDTDISAVETAFEDLGKSASFTVAGLTAVTGYFYQSSMSADPSRSSGLSVNLQNSSKWLSPQTAGLYSLYATIGFQENANSKGGTRRALIGKNVTSTGTFSTSLFPAEVYVDVESRVTQAAANGGYNTTSHLKVWCPSVYLTPSDNLSFVWYQSSGISIPTGGNLDGVPTGRVQMTRIG